MKIFCFLKRFFLLLRKQPTMGAPMSRRKTSILTIANKKGGVGKTTSTVNLASCFAKQKKVLVIDFDPQGNATSNLGMKNEVKKTKKSITLAVNDESVTAEELVLPTAFENLFCIGSDETLQDSRDKFIGHPRQFNLLDTVLNSSIVAEFDLVLIDTNPSRCVLYSSAMAASDYYIIPVFPEKNCLEGIAQEISAAESVRKYHNNMLLFLGCVVTKYDKNNSTHRKVESFMRENSKAGNFRVFNTLIPSSNYITAASYQNTPINIYRENAEISHAYTLLAGEILPHLKGRRVGRVTNQPKLEVINDAQHRFDELNHVAPTLD